MPSKFESKLFPSIARITAAVTVVFVGVVFFVTHEGSKSEQPFRDVYSPDGMYVAAVENDSAVNLSARPVHGTWWNVAEGEGRIADVKWVGTRKLEVDIRPDPSAIGDPGELPRQRSNFADVQVVYRLVPEQVALARQ